MEKSIIKGVKCVSFAENEHYILAVGRSLWVLDRELNLLWKPKELRNFAKAAFLTEDTILFHAGDAYGVASLTERRVLWQKSVMKARFRISTRFAVSKSGRWAYDFYSDQFQNYVVRIDLETKQVEASPLYHDYTLPCYICCDEEDEPLLLEAGQFYLNGECRERMGVLMPFYGNRRDPRCPPNSLHWCWTKDFPGKAQLPLLIRGDWVVCRDLRCFSMRTGEERDLDTWGLARLSEKPLAGGLSRDGRFLMLSFSDRLIVVDWESGALAAQYSMPFAVMGLICGSQILLPRAEGLVRKPFPVLEPLENRVHLYGRAEGVPIEPKKAFFPGIQEELQALEIASAALQREPGRLDWVPCGMVRDEQAGTVTVTFQENLSGRRERMLVTVRLSSGEILEQRKEEQPPASGATP